MRQLDGGASPWVSRSAMTQGPVTASLAGKKFGWMLMGAEEVAPTAQFLNR